MSVLTPTELAVPGTAEKMLRTLFQGFGEFITGKCGESQPLKQAFSIERIPEVIAGCWGGYSFIWENRKHKVVGSALLLKGKNNRHCHISISCDAPTDPIVHAFCETLPALARELRADFACVHSLGPQEVEVGYLTDTVTISDMRRQIYHFSVVPPDLLRYVPDVYWLTIFGPAYVKILGQAVLLKAPGYRVDSLAEDMVMIQCTESVSDVAERFSHFQNARSAIKKHIDHEIFFDSARGKGYPYTVPNFDTDQS